MGFGGNLIWTSVLGAIAEQDGCPVTVCYSPGLSDLFSGRLYDQSVDLSEDVIFRSNPSLNFLPIHRKGILEKTIDFCFKVILRFFPLRRVFESWVFNKAEKLHAEGLPHYIHVDMQLHSYALRQTAKRTYWKTGRAVDSIAKSFGIDCVRQTPTLFYNANEYEHVDNILLAAGVLEPYICIEPDTNQDWFGDLRAWPAERWQQLCQNIFERNKNFNIVQVGLGHSGIIKGAIDLTNKTSFREATLIIAKSKLFIGTESGLMHAASAVKANSLILWGGVTLPDFIGYPNTQKIICKHVECAPCGNMGWCENDRVCMKNISVTEVYDAVVESLNDEVDAIEKP
jgi:glycosyl transferase family 9 (putative heptosyltransferase)